MHFQSTNCNGRVFNLNTYPPEIYKPSQIRCNTSIYVYMFNLKLNLKEFTILWKKYVGGITNEIIMVTNILFRACVFPFKLLHCMLVMLTKHLFFMIKMLFQNIKGDEGGLQMGFPHNCLALGPWRGLVDLLPWFISSIY